MRGRMGKSADQFRDQLEDEIMTGKIAQGTHLDEMGLAARFEVSRTPIREALQQLSAAGLVEMKPRRGAFVAELGPRKLMEMFDVMAELEGMCARLAARRASNDEMHAIREAHDACAIAAETNDPDAYYYENERFHALIRTASHNLFLIEQCDKLQRRLKPFRRLQLRARNRLTASLTEHQEILSALEASDQQQADRSMAAHLAIQGERFTDLMIQLENTSFR